MIDRPIADVTRFSPNRPGTTTFQGRQDHPDVVLPWQPDLAPGETVLYTLHDRVIAAYTHSGPQGISVPDDTAPSPVLQTDAGTITHDASLVYVVSGRLLVAGCSFTLDSRATTEVHLVIRRGEDQMRLFVGSSIQNVFQAAFKALNGRTLFGKDASHG